MTTGLRIAERLNHVAYPTWDTGATHRFYTEVLGFTLVAAVQNEIVPGTSDEAPHLHTFFAMESGETIAFFEVEGTQPPPPDELPVWIRHIAFSVDSRATLDAWRERLRGHGVQVSHVVNHEDGTWNSIYFADPNGVLLELTFQSRPLVAADAEHAQRLVAAWTAARGQRMAS